jgi:hypothetical protein
MCVVTFFISGSKFFISEPAREIRPVGWKGYVGTVILSSYFFTKKLEV